MTFELKFLNEEFNDLKELFLLSEDYLNKKDSNTCIFKIGQITELIIDKIFRLRKFEKASNVYDNINFLKENNIIPRDIYAKLELIRLTRNKAVHSNYSNHEDGVQCIYAAYTLLQWFAENYSREKIKKIQKNIIEANNSIENYIISDIEDDIGVVDYVNDDIDEIFMVKEAFKLGHGEVFNLDINGAPGVSISHNGYNYMEYTKSDGTKYEYEYEVSEDEDNPTKGKYICSNEEGFFVKYQGDLLNCVYHGKGKLIFRDGSRYEGEFKNGDFDGYGVYVTSDGDRYEGEFKDHTYHGEGKLIVCGNKYKGKWVNGKLQSPVKIILANGNRYEGEFKGGKISGNGRSISHNRDRYQGEWENEKPHGKGLFIFANGDRYKGNVIDGNISGNGIYIWSNGVRYEGELVNKLPHGKGIKIYFDGKYEGYFENGLKSGKGILVGNNGYIYDGEFKDDKFHGQGRQIDPDGCRIEGHYENGKINGYGIIIDPNGTRYEGNFKDGRISGKGKYIYNNGDIIHEGEFKDAKRHGKFIETDPSGSRIVYYENGKEISKKNHVWGNILKSFIK